MNQKEKWECFLHLCLMYFWQLQKASLKISHISQLFHVLYLYICKIWCILWLLNESLFSFMYATFWNTFVYCLGIQVLWMMSIFVLYFSALMMTCCCRSISCVFNIFNLYFLLYPCFYWFHLKKHFFIKFISANSQWLYQWETGSV